MEKEASMMGTTFLGIKSKTNSLGCSWVERLMPKIQHPTDILARVHKTTICGTDLHILGGNVLDAKIGLGLGHEGIVDIIEVGSKVKKFKVGDRVLCCCVSSCGKCSMCQKTPSQAGNCKAIDGSWSLGHTIDGMQAQYVRVPHADRSCYKLPASCPRNSQQEDKYLMLADILPTAYEVGLVDGDMKDGKTCAVVGVGPVGLSAILVAVGMYKPKAVIALDLNADRLELAKKMGATHTILVTKDDDYVSKVKEDMLNIVGEDQDGVDLVVEAVGLPSGWYIAQDIVKPGGNIAVLGVHGKPVTMNMERMWYRNFTLTAGMVHGWSVPELMRKVEQGALRADLLITHHWNLSRIETAYDLFNGRREGALKMLLTNDQPEGVRALVERMHSALPDFGSKHDCLMR